MKLFELLCRVEFTQDTDKNVLEVIDDGSVVFSTELHKPTELFKYLDREVKDFNDNFSTDSESTVHSIEAILEKL